MSDYESVQVVPDELLAKLAATAPRPEPPPPAAGKGTAGSGPYKSRLLVEAWLQDRGVAYRRKSQADGKGRTVYVLTACPFNPSHGDPDSCVMQAADGKLSAQCFHNSCKGRGWQEFKAALGPPEAHHYDPPLETKRRRTAPPGKHPPPRPKDDNPGGGAGGGADDVPPDASAEGEAQDRQLPEIQGNHRQLRHVTGDALNAILAANDPPTVFRRGDVLTRLRPGDDAQPPLLEPLGDAALRGVLSRVANWVTLHVTQHGIDEEQDAPPMEVVRDLANLPEWDGVPALDAVVEAPVFARTGELIAAPGFHPQARLWLQPSRDLQVPPVPDRPAPADIAAARDLLLVELLGDFPFTDDASRAHAVAALVLPFVRPLVEGPTPLHLLDAPTEGTGKTLLATAVSLVATGRDVEAIAEATCEEEWRKRITAVLAEGPTIVLLDNLNRTLDSGALASVLTARVWKDRVLGVSKTVRLPNTCLWLASGNNTRLSREIIRRTVWTRLDAKVDAPWLRRDFRHPNLIAWVRANRGPLVGAVLTLAQAWVAAGRPAGRQALGMFEGWTAVVGGILDVAGIPGLLANAHQFRAARADQVSEWRTFVLAWWQRFADTVVGVEQLFDLVTQETLLDSVLGDKGERSQRIRLGQALVRSVDRVIGAYRLERAAEDHKQRQQYRLVEVTVAPAPGLDEAEWVA